MQVKLTQIRVIGAQSAIGKIPDGLPMLQKVGNRLLHVHRGHAFSSLALFM